MDTGSTSSTSRTLLARSGKSCSSVTPTGAHRGDPHTVEMTLAEICSGDDVDDLGEEEAPAPTCDDACLRPGADAGATGADNACPGIDPGGTDRRTAAVGLAPRRCDLPVCGTPEVESIWGQGQGSSGLRARLGDRGAGRCRETTLVGQLLRARLALGSQVLGYSVAPTQSRVLYLVDGPAATNPTLATAPVRPRDRGAITGGSLSGRGRHRRTSPNIGANCWSSRNGQTDTVIIDSLKDAYIGLSDDEASAAYNWPGKPRCKVAYRWSSCTSGQARPGRASPTTLADVYGSTFIPAGAGSVVLLWGQPGDPPVQFRHLKQPMAEVGPWPILHDHARGVSTVHRGADLVQLATIAEPEGSRSGQPHVPCSRTTKPTDAQIEKARRKLGVAGRAEARAPRWW